MRSPFLLLLFVVLLAVPAAAATRNDHKFSMTYSKAKPSTSTGVSFVTDRFAYVAPPAGQAPLHVTRSVFTMAPGTRTDTSVVPACTAAKLLAGGKEACAASKVGQGTAIVITGLSIDPVKETVTVFGGKKQLLAYLEGLATSVVELTLKGNKLTAEVPRTCLPPGTIADGCSNGEAVLKTLDVRLNAKKKGKRALVKTPPRCPASGKWTNKATYTYDNGDTETKTSTTRCRK
jgi:hypothetical protein